MRPRTADAEADMKRVHILLADSRQELLHASESGADVWPLHRSPSRKLAQSGDIAIRYLRATEGEPGQFIASAEVAGPPCLCPEGEVSEHSHEQWLPLSNFRLVSCLTRQEAADLFPTWTLPRRPRFDCLPNEGFSDIQLDQLLQRLGVCQE